MPLSGLSAVHCAGGRVVARFLGVGMFPAEFGGLPLLFEAVESPRLQDGAIVLPSDPREEILCVISRETMVVFHHGVTSIFTKGHAQHDGQEGEVHSLTIAPR